MALNSFNIFLNNHIYLLKNKFNREIEEIEKKLIIHYFIENELNKNISILRNRINSKGLYIPKLTKINGNCFYESLIILGIYKDLYNEFNINNEHFINEQIANFRNEISLIFIKIKNIKYYFNNTDQSAYEIFTNINDIENININNIQVKYDYEEMVNDINSNNTWERLPMELILMIISKQFNVNIFIHHSNSDYISNINENKGDVTKINLGLINEEHYLPLKLIDSSDQNLPHVLLEYNDNKIIYNNWLNNLNNNINK